jgi:copper ion binding protein
MPEINLKMEGMSCQHCVMSVNKAVDSIEGVTSYEVSVGSARLIFDDSKTSRDDIVSAIEKSGYKVV